jgi:hypothetical protein
VTVPQLGMSAVLLIMEAEDIELYKIIATIHCCLQFIGYSSALTVLG